ncbi:hypothetical protein EXU57_24570 [Segetibacter sp. 3557_3]|uniref:hypothetical protein n=1 Tax=Segetibacter sp. 3557_3 TaxID=2547429 RepID=UPI00105881A8|nr:hypothetical protein [Segetibacter sp. 3557_3]TDH18050.1 hypothetical protein EXU57_24570 [Segetibacter sp. 3557_3]
MLPKNINTKWVNDELVQDPSQILPTKRLFGLVGKGKKPDTVHLYMNESLDLYFIINEKDILTGRNATGKLGRKAQSKPTIEGTELYVKPGAELEFKISDRAKQGAAKFLQGDLLSNVVQQRSDGVIIYKPVSLGFSISFSLPTWVICGVSPIASVIIVAKW